MGNASALKLPENLEKRDIPDIKHPLKGLFLAWTNLHDITDDKCLLSEELSNPFLIIILMLEVDADKSLVHTHVQTHVEPASMLTEVLGKSGSCLDDHFGDVVGGYFGHL